MKLARVGARGEEKPAIVDDDNNLRDISTFLPDINPRSLAKIPLLDCIKDININRLPIIPASVRYGACIDMPGKIICIGFNSRAHATELGVSIQATNDILVFLKPSSALCGAFDPILYCRYMKKLDWEAELAIIIGKQGKYIPVERAHEYILGYSCFNDLSERYLQFETTDSQFTKAKGFDNAAPIGPYLVTKDEVHNSSDLQIKLWVNDIMRQDFNTCDYINNDTAVISYLSQYFTLYPGDVISMGSAPGSAAAWGDNQFLKPNDRVTLQIVGLGEQNQLVIPESF